MNLRFYKIWLALSFFSSAAQAAGNGAWDCEQTKNGEWTCLNQGTANSEPAKPQIVKPQPVEAVQPPQPQTVQAQPVVPKPSVQPVPVQQALPAEPAAPMTPVKVAEKPAEKAVEKTEEQTVEKTVAEQPQKHHVKVTQNQKPQLQEVPPIREQVAAAPKQPGWTCQSGGDKQNWNCNLVGPDPHGEEQVVVAAQADSHWMTPTFSHSQERIFQTLRGEFKQDPWQNCEKWAIKKRKIKSVSQATRDSATTDVTADFSEAFEGEVLNFAGNVDLTRADQHLLAEKASYDTVAQTMDAQGDVIYSESSMALAAETASLSLGTDEARLRKTQFISGDTPLRGIAETVYRDSKSLSRYNEAVFTSCAPGNQDWLIHASRMKINREVGQGSAKDAWLEFKGVPVIYTPYISFPTDNRRLTGFLSPTWGSTQRSGFYVAAPFYWNIEPNIDTTITPRYFSGRGEILGNKLRYLTEQSSGSFGAEYMPHDQKLNKSRYSLSLKDKTTGLLPGTSSVLDLNLVSDKTYFNDLNNSLGILRSTVLPSSATLNYGLPNISFSGSVQGFQSVDPTVTNAGLPYGLLPRLSLSLGHDFESMPLKVAMDNQYSSFYRSASDNAQRLVLWPYVSMPFESSAGFFIPKVSVQSSQYQLSGQTLRAGQPASISRTLPVLSLDSGLMLEKPMDFGGTPYTNVIEPRLFYLYIPRKDQSAIPIFDSSAFDTNFNSMFRENSYSGFDRLQDANQITLAATTRYIDSTTGLEPLKASLGQVVYFQDRTVTLPGVPVQTSKTSNIISEVGGQINQNLSYSTGAQWNTEADRLARGQAVLKFRNQPDQIFDIGYRYRSSTANPLVLPAVVPGTASVPATISLTDVSFRWPLFDQWYGLGRWQYSLNFDKTMESFIGLEKENCCWRFRVLGRRFINGAVSNGISSINLLDPNLKPETAFFVQVELKGLSSFGDDIDTFLQNTLNGYHRAGYYN